MQTLSPFPGGDKVENWELKMRQNMAEIQKKYREKYKLDASPDPSDAEEESDEDEDDGFGAKKKEEDQDPAASEYIGYFLKVSLLVSMSRSEGNG